MKTTRRSFLKTTAAAGAGLGFAGTAREALGANHEANAAGSPMQWTRGVGVYPGSPEECFAPVLSLDPAPVYRNLALHRPAFASSSYDYNLTAQLVTDGLVDTRMPRWLKMVLNGDVQPRPVREFYLDHSPENVNELPGAQPALEFHLEGTDDLPEIDRVDLFVVVPDHVPVASLLFTVLTSDDGYTWTVAGTAKGAPKADAAAYPADLARRNLLLAPSVRFSAPVKSRAYRVEFSHGAEAGAAPMAAFRWRLGQVAFYRGAERVEFAGPYHFTSAWRAAGMDEEWVSVDMGARFPIDRVTLHWIAQPSVGRLQISNDGEAWHDVRPLPEGTLQDMRLGSAVEARYVRALVTKAATVHGYVLSEFEVFGRGGFVLKPAPPAPQRADGLPLSGGAWKIQRAPQVVAAGTEISQKGFSDKAWLDATVPGTALVSFLNAGAIPDPNIGDNQLQISDSFFYADFWYRTQFLAPPAEAAVQSLCFEGVNWEAEVFLNGTRLGEIRGAFTRAEFDVSHLLHHGGGNTLAVLVRKNRTPGSCKQRTFEAPGKNGGGLGADNPTFHASIGWDWIPTIRGRNTGLWNEVVLRQTGTVTLHDPLVTTKLVAEGGAQRAEITIAVFAQNHAATPVSGQLRGELGGAKFAQPFVLKANERRELMFTHASESALRLNDARLWWPAGYGEAHLYDVALTAEMDGHVSHALAFRAGLREMTADESGGALRLFINGRRFIPRGGNWGFSESMLRYRAREYDATVRYHREQNFTMIRNWVGQIGDGAFYEACDRHGIVVWQDFWLANPWDGPVPDDDALFLANALDYVAKIRRHACVGLYCGRNEGFPPKVLDDGLRSLLGELHPDIHYIGSSADGPVSGHGPYHALSAPEYFRIADRKLHSEMGAPAIPPIESVREMIPKASLWPQGLSWGMHDFTLNGAQGGKSLLTLIEEGFGGATSAEEWVELAQFLNYDTYRAMFESQSKYRMGLLLWMSHPCWPSFVWQTYDYYLEPTAAYFGCKKACEPLHLQWNSAEDTLEAVNYSAGQQSGLHAGVELINLDGRVVYQQAFPVAVAEDSTATLATMHYPPGLSEAHFLRLRWLDREDPQPNTYLRGREAGNYRAIRTLPQAQLRVRTQAAQQGKRWLLSAQVQNVSPTPALLVRAQVVREVSRDRILPAIFDDNYITLMPGETRRIRAEVEHADTRGERPQLCFGGFNLRAHFGHTA